MRWMTLPRGAGTIAAGGVAIEPARQHGVKLLGQGQGQAGVGRESGHAHEDARRCDDFPGRRARRSRSPVTCRSPEVGVACAVSSAVRHDSQRTPRSSCAWHSACRRRVGPQRRLSRPGRGAAQARRRNGADRMTTQYRHPAPAGRAHVPHGRAARTDPRAATAHGRRLLRDRSARRRGDRSRRNVATRGAVQRSQPGSGLDELRRVLRRSRRRACTVCCWRSRARRSRGRRSAGAAVAVQEAIRMGGTGPLQRSCEATSRRAPPATRRSANARTVSSQRRKSRLS
jgi:hypothetical protein